MKGIICEEPNRLNAVDVACPTKKAGEALIRIQRVGICGTDLNAFRGTQPYFTYPRILGQELSGTIEEIGDNSGHLQVGDPVSIIPYLHCRSCIACRSGKTNSCTKMEKMGDHQSGIISTMITVPTSKL